MAAWLIVIGWITKAVLLLLVGLSVWSVTIMVDRNRIFKKAQGGALDAIRAMIRDQDWKALKKWAESTDSMIAKFIQDLLETKSELAAKSFLTTEKIKLEAGLTVLATLGSNAPFIGLFGTVLGIIQAFGVLSGASPSGETSGGASPVMSAISEALVATAVGLFVAIPAVVAYNVFSRKLKLLLTECEALRDLYFSQIEK